MEYRQSLLRTVSFCVGLPESSIVALAAIAVPLRRNAGAVIQIEGDPARDMYVLVEGRVKVVRIAKSGREQVLNVIGAGGHFNTVPMFDDGPCPANVEALTDVVFLALPREALLRLVDEHPPLARAFLREFTGRLRHLVDLVDELALHNVQGRLAGLLLAQAEAAGNAPAPLLTQAEIAAQLGTVREMIGRTLKSFEAQGLIQIQRGVVTIINQEGLAALHND